MANYKTQKNLVSNRDTYNKYYGDFRGVDFSSDHTNVSERRFAYAVNMYKDYFSGQSTGIETIPGFRKILELNSKIYGIHYYKHKDSKGELVEKVLIHAGEKLYLWSGYPDGLNKSEFTGIEMKERKSTSFVFNNRLYIIDGKNYLVYDGQTIKNVIADAYVPTTRMAMMPATDRSKDEISFVFNNVLYIAGKDMTWKDFVTSTYNDKNTFKIYNGFVVTYDTDVMEETWTGYIVGFKYEDGEFVEAIDSASIRANERYSTELRTMPISPDGYIDNNPVIYPTSNTDMGTELYARNLLSSFAKNTFIGNGLPSRYYLSENNIDDNNVSVVAYGEEVNSDQYTVNAEFGYVEILAGAAKQYFVTPESKGYPEGYAGIEITYKKTIKRVSGVSEEVQDAKDLILGCTIATVFDGRVFLSGNPLCPNHIFWSGTNDTGYIDPSYFGILDYQQDGHGIAPITAMMPVSDSLLVLKDDSQEDGCVYFHTPMETQKDIQPVVYPSTQGLNGIGCLGACVNFLDDPVFMSRLGVKAIGQLSVRLERAMEHRSSMVDSLLLDYDLKNACFTEWGGYLFVLVGGGHIFLADSRQRFSNELGNAEYEWYYLEDIGTYTGQKQPYRYSETIEEIFKGKTVKYDGKEYELEVASKVFNVETGKTESLIGSVANGTPSTVTVTEDNESYTRHYVMYLDINERGEDEYHAYVVEQAEDYIDGTFNPAVILQTLGDTVYFGTANGDLCAFNFDKRDQTTSFIPPEYYTFNNRIIFSGCATKMDNCGIPHLTKSTEKKSTVVKLQTFDSTAAKLKVRTNREPYKQVARINAARTDFESMNFMDIPFQTEGKGIFSVKEKEKKWMEKQYFIYSDEFKKPFALFYAAYRYYVAGRYKG